MYIILDNDTYKKSPWKKVNIGDKFIRIKNIKHKMSKKSLARMTIGKIYPIIGFTKHGSAVVIDDNGDFFRPSAKFMKFIPSSQIGTIKKEKNEVCIFCKDTGLKKQGYDFGQPCSCKYGEKIKNQNISEEVKDKLYNTMLFLRDEPADYESKSEKCKHKLWYGKSNPHCPKCEIK